MNNLKLVNVSNEYLEEIKLYRQELLETNSNSSGTAALLEYDEISEWLKHLEIINNDETCPNFLSPSTLYLLVDGDNIKILGMIDIRHKLNNSLLKVGGHIGYNIRPSERKKGYGKRQLALGLEKCLDMGIKQVLITCDKNNLGSKNIIKANGGQLENIIVERKMEIERYWIDLDKNNKTGC